jgi:AmmeMemoRadiSam system protein B/AmmeMemoRadiSam system protein A
VAGTWYPGDPVRLASQVEVMLEAAGRWEGRGRLRAVVVPHAGLLYSGPTAAHAYGCVEPGGFDRVVVLAPSHRVPMHGAAVDPSTHYETPLGRMPVDTAAVETLGSRPGVRTSARPFQLEHAIEMQLPFLQLRLPQARLVPMLIGELRGDEHDALAAGLAPLLDARTLLVVSSDFVHYGPNYGYVPFVDDVPARIRELDRQAIAAIEAKDFARFQAMLERTEATICGRRPLGVLLHLVQRDWSAELRSYATSGDLTGDFTNSVSYVALIFCEGTTEPGRLAAAAETLVNEAAQPVVGDAVPKGAPPAVRSDASPGARAAGHGLTAEERRQLLRAARGALRGLFAPAAGEPPQLGSWPRLARRTAVFVSLHRRRDGRLRGCIGGLEPRLPLAEAVVESARAAALDDPRFPPLRRDELDDVEIEISVLGPLVPLDDPAAIELGRDGLVITRGLQRGVLLPQVPAQFRWDRIQFLENLCRKAGLPAEAWKGGAQLQRFEAEVFSESTDAV